MTLGRYIKPLLRTFFALVLLMNMLGPTPGVRFASSSIVLPLVPFRSTRHNGNNVNAVVYERKRSDYNTCVRRFRAGTDCVYMCGLIAKRMTDCLLQNLSQRQGVTLNNFPFGVFDFILTAGMITLSRLLLHYPGETKRRQITPYGSTRRKEGLQAGESLSPTFGFQP